MTLIAAGVLTVVATLLHPSRETATTIVASEPRLVAAHMAYTVAWLLVLLGLPGLYAAQRGGMGRLGLVGFADWVEGLRAAAHTARVQGNITLANALDVTRFEVYEGYLDEELDHQQSQAAARRSR
jgi:hypothetical protein